LYRILIIYDVDLELPDGRTIDWCYSRRAKTLQKLSPPDFDIDICSHASIPWHDLSSYPLIYHLDYMLAANFARVELPNAGYPGLYVTSFNKDSRSRQELWSQVHQSADYVVVNNRDRWLSGGIKENTCNVSNGVDSDIFRQKTPWEHRPEKILYRASSGTAKHKRFHEVVMPLKPLLEAEGFICDFTAINDIDETVLDGDQMNDFWNSGKYMICASGSEGTPNGLLEAMTCGCVCVTTSVGNVPEIDGNAITTIADPSDLREWVNAFKMARDNGEWFSSAAMRAMRLWSYQKPGFRAEYFYQLFRRLIDDGPGTVAPFSWFDTAPGEI
jgi:hypothetical protein